MSEYTDQATGVKSSTNEGSASPCTSIASEEAKTQPSPIAEQERYAYVKDLGKGSFGRVVLAHDKEEGDRLVAIKLISRRKYNQYTEREVENHLQLIHPHIVRLYDLFLTPDYLALVLEYADQGDMYSFLVKHRRLSEPGARWLVQQVAIALDFLHKAVRAPVLPNFAHTLHHHHSQGISLRDLKLENILLRGSPSKPIVKLCDLGFSKSDVLHSAPDSTVGTLAYTAPEVITGKVYDGKQTDAWALGVLMFVLMAGAYPFERSADKELHPVKRQRAQMQRIMKCEMRMWPSEASAPSDACMELIKGLLTVDPKKRMSIADALQHPWMTEGLPKGALEMNDKFAGPQLTAQLPKHIATVLRRARDGAPASRSPLSKSSKGTTAPVPKPTPPGSSVERVSAQTVSSKTSESGRGRSAATSLTAASSPPSRSGNSWRPADVLAVYDSLVNRLVVSTKRKGAEGPAPLIKKRSSLIIITT